MSEKEPIPSPILDLARFREATGDDAGLMLELADLYVSDGDAQLALLVEAAAAGDLERFGRLAHGLKGSSASIGADWAAEAFRRLEFMGRTGEIEGLEGALAYAREAYEETKIRLRRLAA